ncbi:MAG: uL15m family ribosomal protein [Candidatus Woesearchaeota archaeon]
MVSRKRSKNSRQRAGTTHGWGAMKKHRGAGNRGGVGNAGSGKRGDAKKPSYWKDSKYFGMHGFKRKGIIKSVVTANVSDLDRFAEKAGSTTFSLADFGITKLLGDGLVTKAYTVTVESASSRALEKIEGAKGKVTVLSRKASPKAEE